MMDCAGMTMPDDSRHRVPHNCALSSTGAISMSGYAPAPGTRVLAIDDDPSQRTVVVNMLAAAGFDVEVACDGGAGLAQIQARSPHLVLCDVAMPGMDGFEVLDALRGNPATMRLPVVLVTARSDREAVRRGMRLGADDFLSKPVRALELVEAVGAALDKQRRLSALDAPIAELAGVTGRMLTQTVLFSDIRGFTAISERLPVAEVAELLSRYLQEACAPILHERGRVMKIMGDGVMALFGHDAPEDVASHAAAALRAGREIVEVAQRFREWIGSRFDLPGLPPFDVGVGIHTGQVMLFHLSAVGGAGDLTAVGDTVNIAARLEAKSKELGWPVVASLATLEHAGEAGRAAEKREVELTGRGGRIFVGRLDRLPVRIARVVAAARIEPAALPTPVAEFPTIGGYDIVQKIGEGGMSSVFLADERAQGRRVVLKVLKGRRSEDEVLWSRFFQECAILSSVEHPNVVRIHDQGFGDDLAYIAMEHLAGGTLREVIARRVWPRQALGLLSQAGEALAEIHRRGIVHRDIKPANLMLRDEKVLVLTDFGVAKRLSRAADQTLHGEIIGTPYYISPEQAAGEPVTPRADLYSLGVIFYEMLTGQRPFGGETIHEVLGQHISAPVPRLAAALDRYQELMDGLLAKRPQDRFSSAEVLLGAIERVCSA
jgi:serine/threonine-protein kinase PpkA